MDVCNGLVASTDEPPTISEIMHKAIDERVFPGGAVAFGSCTIPCYYQAYGTYTFESSVPINPESTWDLASLTKIMVTVPSVMLLYDRRLIDLDAAACKYVPEFGVNGKHIITIRQLLTHTAGLREFYPFFDMGITTRQQVLEYIMNDKLWYAVGGMAKYSDLSMIVLGIVVERISGLPLDVFATREFFQPLGMRDTSFRPVDRSEFDPMVVPTEVDRLHRNRLLWGEVHDPSSFLLGGVAGHAGLFSSILDVSKFAQMILAGGMDLATNRRFFKESTLRLFTTPGLKTNVNPRPFALGWDVAVRRSLDGYTSAGKFMGPRTFGHTGFTGTSLWIDPDRNLFVALLTNAVHPTAKEDFGWKVRDVRPLVANAAVLAMGEQAIPRETLTWHLATVDQEPLPQMQAAAAAALLAIGDELSALHDEADEKLGSCSVVRSRAEASQQQQRISFASVTSSVLIGVQHGDNSSSRRARRIIWLRLVPFLIIVFFVHFK